jgi:uncharacterized protein with PQ loop repeat
VDVIHQPERLLVIEVLMMITVLGVAAATWGLVMAVSPLLQIRQMWQRQSSADVSVGFFAVLLPGFVLWIAYGVARADLFLILPNVVALVVGGSTIAVAQLLRRRRAQETATAGVDGARTAGI